MKNTPQSATGSIEQTNTTTSSAPESASSVGWTDISNRGASAGEATVDEPVSAQAADAAVAEFTIPEALPDPEVTLFRDTTSVIRLLRKKRTENRFELRLYHADDQSVEHIIPVDHAGLDSGPNSRIEALPEPARRRFEDAVGAVTEQLSLSLANTSTGHGQCRHRRPNHGFCGVLEFSVTLHVDEPTRS